MTRDIKNMELNTPGLDSPLRTMTNGEIYNKWLWEDDGNNTAFDLMEAVRADERAKIVSMIEEIAHFTLYCMADMCDREDKNCEKCGLEYVIKRIREQSNE